MSIKDSNISSNSYDSKSPDSKGRRKPVSLYLDDATRIKLEHIQNHTGVPFQPLVRIALNTFVSEFNKTKEIRFTDNIV